MAFVPKEIFKSKPFTFLVGKARTPFMVHKDAISMQSHALDVLVNGSMEEAQKGLTVIEDVSEDTFMQFYQFIYHGDYEPHEHILEMEPEPEPEPMPASGSSVKSDDIEDAEMDEVRSRASSLTDSMDGWADFPITLPKTTKYSKSRVFKEKFEAKTFVTEIPITQFIDRCRLRHNEKSTENYTPVLLGHAQMYVFAEKWNIEILRNLSLDKLHRTLVEFELYETRREDIVKLAQYAYSDEHTPDTPRNLDPLRALVIQYVTCCVDSLIRSRKFMLLLENNAVLGRDLVTRMIHRID